MVDPGPSHPSKRPSHPPRYRQRPPPGFYLASPLENITSLFPSFGAPKSSPSSSSSFTFPSSGSSPSSSSKRRSQIDDLLQNPIIVGVISAVAALGIAGGGWYSYRTLWRRIKNVNDVTGGMLDKKKWIRGVVTSVGDGDNFRVFHTPGPFYRWPLKLRSVPTATKDLKDETLHIRIAAVDAPENAHFGNPAQPFAKESWDWMRALLTGKRVKVQLIRKDQYLRVVGVPYLQRFILRDKPIPLLMLREGMGVVYESGGAEYGPWSVAYLKRLEAEAKKAKKGLWGVKGRFEHPAEYKKRIKMVEEVGVQATVKTTPRAQKGWLSRIFGT